MKNLKRVLIVLSLICVVGLGATYALMSSTTNTAVNTFTSSKNVSIDLREPGWDGYGFGDTLPTNPGSTAKPGQENNKTLGLNQATDYQPMDVITKDPTVKNTSTSTDNYAAIKVEFEGPNGAKLSRTDFEAKYGKLDLDSTKFEEVTGTGYSLFIYKTILTKDATATPFTKVTLNKDIVLVNDALPTFKIKTTGYATQANISYDDAKTELTNLAK